MRPSALTSGKEQRRVKLKKLSLQPEKCNEKGAFEGWVNQFEEYAMLGGGQADRKGTYVFHRPAGARKYDVPSEGQSPPVAIWAGDQYQYCAPGVGWLIEGEEPVGQGAHRLQGGWLAEPIT